MQTGASAGSSIAAGVIFTVPALVILGYWEDFKYSWVLAIAGLGGVLGVLFSVPLRRSLIVDQQPRVSGRQGRGRSAQGRRESRAGHQGARRLRRRSAAWRKLIAASGLRIVPDAAAHGGFVGKAIAYMGTNLSPALLGVGYIVGLNIGIVVVAGGILSWNIAIPIYSAFFLDGDPELAARHRRRRRRRRGGRDLERADPLPRRRRDADRRHLDADLAAQVAAVGRSQRPRRHARRRRPSRRAHRAATCR